MHCIFTYFFCNIEVKKVVFKFSLKSCIFFSTPQVTYIKSKPNPIWFHQSLYLYMSVISYKNVDFNPWQLNFLMFVFSHKFKFCKYVVDSMYSLAITSPFFVQDKLFILQMEFQNLYLNFCFCYIAVKTNTNLLLRKRKQ